MKYTNPREASPVDVFFNLVGGKYKGAILWYLARRGTLRFSEIKKCLPKVNPKTLTQQLRALERDGLLVRTIYPEVPPRVEYGLTKLGEDIFPLIQEIHCWAVNYVWGLPKEKAPVTVRMRMCYSKERN